MRRCLAQSNPSWCPRLNHKLYNPSTLLGCVCACEGCSRRRATRENDDLSVLKVVFVTPYAHALLLRYGELEDEWHVISPERARSSVFPDVLSAAVGVCRLGIARPGALGAGPRVGSAWYGIASLPNISRVPPNASVRRAGISWMGRNTAQSPLLYITDYRGVRN
jgi:hypothetical protein